MNASACSSLKLEQIFFEYLNIVLLIAMNLRNNRNANQFSGKTAPKTPSRWNCYTYWLVILSTWS